MQGHILDLIVHIIWEKRNSVVPPKLIPIPGLFREASRAEEPLTPIQFHEPDQLVDPGFTRSNVPNII